MVIHSGLLVITQLSLKIHTAHHYVKHTKQVLLILITHSQVLLENYLMLKLLHLKVVVMEVKDNGLVTVELQDVNVYAPKKMLLLHQNQPHPQNHPHHQNQQKNKQKRVMDILIGLLVI